MINPKQVKSFLAVVEMGSVNGAAERLCLAPSSVSVQLKALADTLGVALFEPTGRGISVTPIGRQLVPKLQQLITLNHDVIATAQSMSSEPVGELRLYAPSSMCIYRLPLLIDLLQGEAPAVELHLQHDPLDFHNAFENREIEAAIIVSDKEEPGYDSLRIAEEEVIYVTHPSIGTSRTVDLQYLLDKPLITTEPDCSYRKAAENHFQNNSLRLEPRQCFSNVEVIRRCLLAKMGIGILPRCVVMEDLENGVLVQQPVKDTPYQFDSKLIWPKEAQVSPRLRSLQHVIRAQED